MSEQTQGLEGKTGEDAADKRGKEQAADQLPGGEATRQRDHGREASLDRAPDYAPVYPGSGRLSGKVAIVTGGDSGIGRAVCALYAREGARIAIVHHRDVEDAEATRAIVEQEGSEALVLTGDVADPAFCAQVVKDTVARFGRLDVLVNNAGTQCPADDIADISVEQLERTFRVNIFAMFHLVKAALPHLERGAAIVNCASITAYQGAESLLDYSSTKGAIVSFTRSLSANLADKGIRVNAVAPGPIWTPLNPLGGADADKVRTFGETTKMKRAGEPNEVAPSFLFLACADSSYMSGQTLHPNGGEVVNG